MKREEAIKILADLTDNIFLHTWEEQYKALHMAIEALKAEPIMCKDCKHYSVEGKTTRFGWCNALEMPTDEMRYCSDGESEVIE